MFGIYGGKNKMERSSGHMHITMIKVTIGHHLGTIHLALNAADPLHAVIAASALQGSIPHCHP